MNVLPHELSHMYDLVGLDFGKGEEGVWGGEKRGEEFGQLVGAIQGVGTGFAKSSQKFLQEKLERVASNFNSKECIQDYWRMREKGKGRAVPARRLSQGAAANTANGSPLSSSSSGL